MNGDKKPVIIQCIKNGKKFRTYVFNAEQHVDTIERCYKIFAKIKKALGTSMEVKSASENDEDKNTSKKNDSNSSDDSPDEVRTPKSEKPDKSEKPEKKKKKVRKTINYVNDPVFSFGGDQINKIIKFLTTNKFVANDMIKI
jgi:hypothetical protein